MATSDSYTTETLYLFSVQYPKGHSLFKMDIAMPENEEGDWRLSSPELIHRFHCGDKGIRNYMGCGKFGSKLFILGGFHRYENAQGETVTEFPLDVMVYDPAASSPDASLTSSNVSQMKSAKINPIMFEVGGKLYVLGNLFDYFFGGEPGPDIFEEYSPDTNEWRILDVPPIKHRRSCGWTCSFVLDSATVVIQGNRTEPLYVFNPKTYDWTKLELPAELLFFSYCPFLIKDCIYGAGEMATVMKVGPISLSALTNGVYKFAPKPAREDPVMDWGGRDPDSIPNPLMLPPIAHYPVMCHLGDWKFCLLQSASYLPGDAADCYEIAFDIYIHEISQHDRGCLKAKCLHTATFTVKTGAVRIGQFIACHLMSSNVSILSKKISFVPMDLSIWRKQ